MGTSIATNHLCSPSKSSSLPCTINFHATLHPKRQSRSTIWESLRQQLSYSYQISSNISLSYVSGICRKVGSSTKISAGPTLFLILQEHFYDVFHSRAATLISKMFCSMLCSSNPPFQILTNSLRIDNKHNFAGLFKDCIGTFLSKELPSHLHAWIKKRVQPCNTIPILLLADVLVGCRFPCAITLGCVATFVPYGWAHDIFMVIIMPST